MLRNRIYRILNPLDVHIADSQVPASPNMPFGLGMQILRHDGGKNNELGLEDVEDAVVGEKEAVGDVGGDPG